ncbi:hypothetical protein NPIL_278561 [Nephila pilipes]|uniref:Uncharacterized protein n=1 Tax=Nephila pilipes TaxID=299642 RepID=A0A8X6TWT8_NEPPI|nr:hypothetical protein NPIL_278561 [Nephila pilipes]
MGDSTHPNHNKTYTSSEWEISNIIREKLMDIDLSSTYKEEENLTINFNIMIFLKSSSHLRGGNSRWKSERRIMSGDLSTWLVKEAYRPKCLEFLPNSPSVGTRTSNSSPQA